jgi:hypothetical protein
VEKGLLLIAIAVCSRWFWALTVSFISFYVDFILFISSLDEDLVAGVDVFWAGFSLGGIVFLCFCFCFVFVFL